MDITPKNLSDIGSFLVGLSSFVAIILAIFKSGTLTKIIEARKIDSVDKFVEDFSKVVVRLDDIRKSLIGGTAYEDDKGKLFYIGFDGKKYYDEEYYKYLYHISYKTYLDIKTRLIPKSKKYRNTVVDGILLKLCKDSESIKSISADFMIKDNTEKSTSIKKISDMNVTTEEYLNLIEQISKELE